MDQIDLIKAQLFKLDMMLRGFSRLQPVFEDIPGKDDLAEKAAFSAWLGHEFTEIGVELDADTIRMLTDGLCTIGIGAMALAIFAVTRIAEDAADLALSQAELTPADFDAEAVKGRWQEIAEKSDVYASTPARDPVGPFFWVPPSPEFSAAEENLVETLFPGLRAGNEVTLTKDFADVTTHGVEVRGLVLNTDTMATASNLVSLPFGQGVQAGESFVFANLVEQMTEKTAALGVLLGELLRGSRMSTSGSVRLRVESGGFKFELEGRQEFVSAEYPKLLATLDGTTRPQVVIRMEGLGADSASAQGVVTNLQREMQQLKEEFCSLSELGEQTSLRMQMKMDLISKAVSALSNVLKKISDTAERITQNLK